jgi:hypothetical protein
MLFMTAQYWSMILTLTEEFPCILILVGATEAYHNPEVLLDHNHQKKLFRTFILSIKLVLMVFVNSLLIPVYQIIPIFFGYHPVGDIFELTPVTDKKDMQAFHLDEAQDQLRLVYESRLLEEIYQSQIFSVFILFYFLCYKFVNFYRKNFHTNDLRKLERSKKVTWREI